MSRNKKVFAVLAWITTLVFVVAVIFPSVAKLMGRSYDGKSEWINFQLKDEAGQQHVGCVNLVTMGERYETVLYGYQAPAGMDLSKWRVPLSKAQEIDGFEWSDKGFLWTDHSRFGAEIKEGTRIGLDRAVSPTEQTELTLPGAPWDMYSSGASFLGKYPHYAVKFDNKNFTFDLNFTAAAPAWHMYNGGKLFPAGDLNKGAMNEVNGTLKGTITHKLTGKTFNVSGDALMEGMIGAPANGTLGWGEHDWTAVSFPGGWGGSFWVAKDDWQWGYNGIHHGWFWDPERKQFLDFYRVELLQADTVTSDRTGKTYYPRTLWRAIGPEATLEFENNNVSALPRENHIFPLVKIAQVWGPNTIKGRLMRRDGTVVDLAAGSGWLEHFSPMAPDYKFWGPVGLILLVLTWSAYAAAIRKEAGRSVLPSVAWCAIGLFGVWCLNLVWS